MAEQHTCGECFVTLPATKTVRLSAWWLWVVFGTVAGTWTAAGQADSLPGIIEVFTATDLPLVDPTGAGPDPLAPGVEVQVYRLDGIERAESDLSRDLPGDPDSASRVALERIQRLDRQTRDLMQRSALGLAKAVQYGIDRTPAVVFDGEAVVYGVTILRQALGHYRDWRARVGR